MNAYLIVSDTIYHAKEALNKIKKGIDNLIVFDMSINTINEVLEEASYFSMFDDKKCIVVKNAPYFSSSRGKDSENTKEDIDKILNYLNNENKNTTLVFITDKCDGKKKIVSIFKDHNNFYYHSPLTKTEMKNELYKILKNNGYSIEDKSLWHIVNNSLNNFDLAYNEIIKIMTYYNKPQSINYNDVLKLTAKTIEDNNFKIVDSIISKDLSASLSNLEIVKAMKIEPSIILALLYRDFKLMLGVNYYEKKNFKRSDIAKILNLQDWQLDKVYNNKRLYNEREIKEEIIKLSDIDYQYKSGLINRDVVLINYVIDLCS